MSRNVTDSMGALKLEVAPREGCVSRNACVSVNRTSFTVAPREGCVSRNFEKIYQ